VVLRLGRSEIHGPGDLGQAVSAFHVGDSVTAVVRRDGRELTLPVHFTDADGPGAAAPEPPAVNPCMPYRVLPLPDKADGLAQGLQDGTSVSVNGDVLSIVRRDARSDLRIKGSFQLPMGRVPGTDLWVLQMKMRGWRRAFFSYEFYSSLPTAGSVVPPGTSGRYRGTGAPAFPEELATLRGRLVRTTLQSTHLGEARGITVYLPPSAPAGPLPVLYMMDGATEAFAHVLEPLILAGKTRPFAVVGADAGAGPPAGVAYSLQADRRAQEYLPGVTPEVFDRHMRFFTGELLPWAERTYLLSQAPGDRALFGFSNGAVFALAVAVEHPELFGTVLPFSAGDFMEAPRSGPLPRVFLAAGEFEPGFLAANRKHHKVLRSAGADAALESYMSGHDSLMWQVALVHYMPRVFPPMGAPTGPAAPIPAGAARQAQDEEGSR
jgi:enterochelin esterase-like enzyme